MPIGSVPEPLAALSRRWHQNCNDAGSISLRREKFSKGIETVQSRSSARLLSGESQPISRGNFCVEEANFALREGYFDPFDPELLNNCQIDLAPSRAKIADRHPRLDGNI